MVWSRKIPGLLLSIGTAIIVTRQNKEADLGEQMSGQLGNLKVLIVSAGLLTIMGIVPGMPHLAFLSLAALLGGAAYFIHKKSKAPAIAAGQTRSELVPIF